MACNDGLTKIWISVEPGTTYHLKVTGPDTGGFTAIADVFERKPDEDPVLVETWKLHPAGENSLKLKAGRNYFVTTHVLITSAKAIDVEVASDISPTRKHCTTINGKNLTSKNVEDTINMKMEA